MEVQKKDLALILFSLIGILFSFHDKFYIAYYDKTVSFDSLNLIYFLLFSPIFLAVFGIILLIMYSKDSFLKGLLGIVPYLVFSISSLIRKQNRFLFIYLIGFGIIILLIILISSFISRKIRNNRLKVEDKMY